MMATYAALERPDVFGKSAGCSVHLPNPLGDRLLAKIEEGEVSAARFLVLWNRYELYRADWGIDMAGDSRRVIKALEARGFDAEGSELLDGAGWGSWRAQVGAVLEEFFPL